MLLLARRLSYALVAIGFAAVALISPPVAAAKKTVCAITINSPDERDIFRRYLPADEYDVVELVERGRDDWLAAACRRGVRCDALVISGHFDGGVEFYSDRLDQRESLPVDVLEQAACSDACPALFGALKEVYLFGCNTLNAEVTTQAGAEVERALLKRGASREEAAGAAAMLNDAHARSNRDRMRLLFSDVPLLYGFSGKAPLGHVAGPVLERHLQTGAVRDVASGRPSAELLKRFAAVSMTATAGATANDPQAAYRRDVCRFQDRRGDAAAKVAFAHEVLRRDIGQVRVLLDAIERFVSGLPAEAWARDDVQQAFAVLREDAAARERFLHFARGNDEPLTRARMIDVGHALGWLSDAQRADERRALLQDRLAQRPGVADVDLACRLGLDGAPAASPAPPPGVQRTAAQAAMLACLGDEEARRVVLDAVVDGQGEAGEVAEVLLHHRPLSGIDEFRRIATRVDRIASADAQARALAVLAKQPMLDEEVVAVLARLFPASRSLAVQRGIAEVLLRADYRGPDRAQLARLMRDHRVRAAERDVIDVLVRRLGAS